MPTANSLLTPPPEHRAAARPLRLRPKVALVLGAGSLKCAAGFGVVKVLQQHAVPIDLVVGCSGSAFCASWLARGGGDADAVARDFARGWDGAFDRLNYRALLSAVFPRLLRFDGSAGIVSDRAINAAIRDFAGDALIEGLRMPLHLVASDFITGEPVLLSRGRLADAIRATIALPLILPPMVLGGRRLVDGAVCNPLPVNVAVQEGADIIIAVGFEDALQSEFHSGIGLLRQLITLMVNRLYRAQYAFYNLTHHAETLAVIPTFERRIGRDDVQLVPYLVQRGAEAMEQEMPYLLRLLAAPARARANP